MSPDDNDPGVIERSINDTGSQLATTWLTFVTLQAFLAVTVGSVTHRMLFLKTSLKIPLLDVQIPFVGFFSVTPILFLILSLYLALQINSCSHAIALYRTELDALPLASSRARRWWNLSSFFLIQILAGNALGRLQGSRAPLLVMAIATLVIGPLALLMQIEIVFLPYHLAWVTWEHRAAVVLEVSLIAGCYYTIRRKQAPHMTPAGLAVALCSAVLVALISIFVITYPGELPRSVLASAILPSRLGAGTLFEDSLALPGQAFVDSSSTGQLAGHTISLRGRQLSGANLSATDIHGADLGNANLDGAVLDAAHLEDSLLGCTNLYSTECSSTMRSARLRQSYLSRSLLDYALMQGAQLSNAALDSASLSGADITDGRLFGATLVAAKLNGTILNGAILDGANLDSAELNELRASRASFRHATLAGATLRNAQLEGARLDDAHLWGASLYGAHLRDASLNGAELQGASLRGADMRGVDLRNADLRGVALDNANLEGAVLDDANLQGANLAGANLRNASLNRALVWRAHGMPSSLVDVSARSLGMSPAFGNSTLFRDWRTSIASEIPAPGFRNAALKRLQVLDPALSPDPSDAVGFSLSSAGSSAR
jgi:uncharacterized protein YjbI with pentapeptide repeats